MSTYHVFPIGDLIEHSTDWEADDCVCGPTVEAVFADENEICVGWLMVHHSLDGRELNE